MTLSAQSTNLAELARWSCETYGDTDAIRDGDVAITFSELGELSRQAAAAIVAAEVEPGDVVAIWAPNCWQWVVMAMGVSRAGAVLLPVNTRFKGAEAAHVLNTAEAKLVFVVDGFLDTSYTAMLASQDLKTVREVIDFSTAAYDDFVARGVPSLFDEVERRTDAVTYDDIGAIMFTSGTTGHPKGVLVGGGAMIRAFNGWGDAIDVRQGDPYLIVNPYFHAFGFNGGIVMCLLFGAVNIPFPVYEPVAVMQTIEREKVTIFPGPPALYQGLLNHPDLEKYDLRSLRGCVTGAASIPVEMIEAMRTRLGFEDISTAYGMTETSGIVMYTLRGDPDELVSTTSGCVIDDVEVRIVDEHGNDVPVGQPGELYVRGYQVTPGYLLGDGGVTKATDDDGWLHTGDVVVMNDVGYIDITDRIKDMYIVGGFNAYPAEIERMMVEHPEIGIAAVIGVPEARLGEVGAAFIVRAPGSTIDEAGVIAWCREEMANYKVPRHVWFVDNLPLTPSNKVQKPVLREWAAERMAQ